MRWPQTSNERFWGHVSKTDGCWEWTGSTQGRGYGSFFADGRSHQAHRWIYEQFFGPQPKHIHICHKCDNPICIRPDHLFAGTRSDNMKDCAGKGRNVMQKFPERSHFKGKNNIQCRGERQGNSKLKSQDIAEIKSLASSGLSSARIAPMFGVHPAHVRKIVRGNAWAHTEAKDAE